MPNGVDITFTAITSQLTLPSLHPSSIAWTLMISITGLKAFFSHGAAAYWSSLCFDLVPMLHSLLDDSHLHQHLLINWDEPSHPIPLVTSGVS